MPYVLESYRDTLRKELEELIIALKMIKDSDMDGCVNYSITKILDELYGGGGYAVYERAIGVLECAKQEYYRCKIAPYEDKKRKENGDVYV